MISLVNLIPGSGGWGDAKHAPLAILYLGGALKDAGFACRAYHILPPDIDATVEKILKDDPIYVGFSVLTGLPVYWAAQMSKKIRAANPKIPIVWGGHHPSYTAEQCLREDYVDIVAIGEGEATAVDLAQTLDRQRPLEHVPGIAFKQNGRIIVNPERPRIQDVDRLWPDWSLVNVEDYLLDILGTKTISYYSSRGCPFACTFCSASTFFERTWRPHSPEYIIGGLTELKERHGVTGVFFGDDLFFQNATKERAIKIVEGLSRNGIRTNGIDVRITDFKQDTIERLDDAGLGGIFFGWESGSDRMLRMMKKGFQRKHIIAGAQLMAKYPEILLWGSAIFGMPTETREEVQATIDTCVELLHIHPNITSTFQIYLPFPGTEMIAQARQHGFQMPERAEDWARIDTFADEQTAPWVPWIGPAELERLRATVRVSRALFHRRPAWKGRLASVVNNAFVELGCLRVKHRFFSFPVEITLYKFLKGYWRPTARSLRDLEAPTLCP